MARYIEGPKEDISYDQDLGTLFFKTGCRLSRSLFQIDLETGESETFEAAKSRAIKTAIYLRNEGITQNDIVAVCGTNSLDTAIPCIASMYIGVRVTTLEVRLAAREFEHCLRTVTPTIIFVHEMCVNTIESTIAKLEIELKIVVFGNSKKYQKFSDICDTSVDESSFEPTKVDSNETAFILFTSGTSGLPKGICLSHRALFYSARSYVDDIHGNVILAYASLFWISGICALVQSQYKGYCRVIGNQFHPVKFMEAVEKYRVNFVFVPPILAHILLSVPNLERFDTSSLFNISIGGENCIHPVLTAMRNLFKYSVVQLNYGTTEVAGPCTTFHVIDKEIFEAKAGSSGQPIKNTVLKVVELETREMLPPNERGELCVKSPGLFNGYYNLDSSDQFDEEGFLKTGDIAYYDADNYIYIVDRSKDIITYQLWHLAPMSIELVIKQHPSVREAVVFGIPHAVDGAHAAALVALKEGVDTTAEDLLDFVNSQVPDREQLRGGLKLIKQIPKSHNGKYVRSQLRELYLKME